MLAGNKKTTNQYNSQKSPKLRIYLPILLVFVSITSFIAGTRIGQDSGNRRGMMLDTIVLSPDGETAEETVDEPHIQFSGRILNADGTPCANQLLELHSDPMRTTTDSDGIFHFQRVDIGNHQLIMLDESEQVLSQIAVSINRDNAVSFGQLENVPGSVHLAVSENTVELHIQIQLSDDKEMKVEPVVYTRKPGESFRDSSGEEKEILVSQEPKNEPAVPESGEGLVNQENVPVQPQPEIKQPEQSRAEESHPMELQTDPNNRKPSETQATEPETAPTQESQQPEPAESRKNTESGWEDNSGGSSNTRPSQSETTKAEEPTEPEPTEPEPTKPEITPPETTEPETTPPEPTETQPTKPEAPLDVSVQEKGGPVWAQNTTISLFADRTGVGEDRKLAPGSKGTYEFLVSNKNTYGIIYQMKIMADKEQLLLPLHYRLKSGGKYLCGDSKTWLTAEQLASASVKLDPGMEKEYLLEWYWPYEGGDDAYDTLIGTADNLEYRLIVNIVIEQVVS